MHFGESRQAKIKTATRARTHVYFMPARASSGVIKSGGFPFAIR